MGLDDVDSITLKNINISGNIGLGCRALEVSAFGVTRLAFCVWNNIPLHTTKY